MKKMVGQRRKNSFWPRIWVYFIASFSFLLAALIAVLLFLFVLTPFLKEKKETALPPWQTQARGPVRGEEGDFWADIILGQRDFTQIAPHETVPDKLFHPGGVVIDKTVTPNVLYVVDSGNNRVLGFRLGECLSRKISRPDLRCQPFKVIGQPDFYSNSCNGDSGFQHFPQRAAASASSLCLLPDWQLSIAEGADGVGLYISEEGDLYLPDAKNNRILKYNRISTSDTVADEVWGQSDFAGNLCNRGGRPSAATLCLEKGYEQVTVKLDPEGNLWVTDVGNHRVLRFPKQADGNIAKVADLVLGQWNFFHSTPGKSLVKFNKPSGLAFDSQGRLYVADQNNHRILVFDPPFATGMRGKRWGSKFYSPLDIKVEKIAPGQDKIWVNDFHNGMIEVWNNAGTQVLKVYGKEDYLPEGPGNRTGECFDTFGSFDWDNAGRLFVTNRAGIYISDILVFEPQNLFAQPTSDMQLFSPPTNTYNLVGPRGMNTALGVVVTSNQLIVTDSRRILFWNQPQNLTNGQPISGFIAVEREPVYRADGSLDYSILGVPVHLIKKDNLGHLWVTTSQGGKPPRLSLYSLPLTTGAKPLRELLFGCLKTLEGEEVCNPDSHWYLFGLAPDPGGRFVWLSHPRTHRVFRVRNPLGNDPRIDIILGQRDSRGICCNQEVNPNGSCKLENGNSNASLDKLCFPGAVSLDNFGNLYVADQYLEINGNFRLLIFKKEDLPLNNSRTLYAIPAFKQIKNIAAFDMAFDGHNRLVMGQNGLWLSERPESHFLAYFNNPLEKTAVRPDGYFHDYYSIPFSVAFDFEGNLYATAHNRSRVMIYKRPFGPDSSPPIFSWCEFLFDNLATCQGKSCAAGDLNTSSCWLVDFDKQGQVDQKDERIYRQWNFQPGWCRQQIEEFEGVNPCAPLTFDCRQLLVLIKKAKKRGGVYDARADVFPSSPDRVVNEKDLVTFYLNRHRPGWCTQFLSRPALLPTNWPAER